MTTAPFPTLRWGIVGCGDIVRKRVARAIGDHPGCILSAACRRHDEALAQFAAEHQVPHTTTDWQSLVRIDELDVIYVATPVDLHAAQTIAALEQGKHVLVEKPMATCVAECDQMIAAAQANGKQLGVAYYRRFYPAVERIASAIGRSELGTLMSIRAQTGHPFQFKPDDQAYWRAQPEHGGGGPLMDIGSHRLDLFHLLGGPPKRVTGLATRAAATYHVEDNGTVLVEFGGGAQGVLQCYFGTEYVPDELTVVGTRGVVHCSPLNDGVMTWNIAGNRWSETLPPHDNLHAPLIADFYEAVIDNRPPRIGGNDGRIVNQMIGEVYALSDIKRPG